MGQSCKDSQFNGDFVDTWLELIRTFVALSMPRAKKFVFFGHAPRRSVPDALSRRPHIEVGGSWTKLNWIIGWESYVTLLAKFLVPPDTLDYLISQTDKNPKEK